jgi:hypothetical protein
MLVITQDTDLDTLRTKLLSGRIAGAKAESALQSLQDLNPHADLKKLAPGTVLLVPETASFKSSASRSVGGGVLDEFQQLVRSDFASAAGKLKAANEARAADNAEVSAVLRIAAVKRIIDADPELKQQLDDAVKAFKTDQEEGAKAEQTLEAATKGALAELATLSKLLG